MPNEREHRGQLAHIEAYYNLAQKFYENLWYSRNQGLGLHYGFKTEGVKDRIQAILKENEILADLVRVKKGDKVLDAGSGVCGSGIWLAKNRGAHTIELNIVDKQLKIGQKLVDRNRVGEQVYLTRADYHRLPFADKSFDVFWSLESIEHSDDLPVFISEAHRILKPSGRVVIAGTFKGNQNPTPEQTRQLNVGFRAAGAFNDFRSAVEVSDLMKTVGFKSIRVINSNDLIMESARQMEAMCMKGLPLARMGNKMGIVSQIMVDNTEWGTYQANLFKEGVTSYDIIVAQK